MVVKFSAILLFVTLWMFVVYFPLAHMVWGVDGFMNGVWNAKAKVRAMTDDLIKAFNEGRVQSYYDVIQMSK